jgi:hypothetical protein
VQIPSEPTGRVQQGVNACPDYSVLTQHNDNQRTGVQGCETILTKDTVPFIASTKTTASGTVVLPNATFVVPDGGHIYGQPLFVHGSKINGSIQDAVIVATSTLGATSQTGDSVYILNPSTLQQIAALHPNTRIAPPGIASTPVVDSSKRFLFFVSADCDNPTGALPNYSLKVADLAASPLQVVQSMAITGACAGSVAGDGGVAETFRPFQGGTLCTDGQSYPNFYQTQRAALLVTPASSGMNVFVAVGARGAGASSPGQPSGEAAGYYNGWVFAFNYAPPVLDGGTGALTQLGNSGANAYCVSRAEAVGTPSIGRGGIWQFGAGPAADLSGFVYASTGNGWVDTNDDGQSFIQLNGGNWAAGLSSQGKPTGRVSDLAVPFTSANDIDLASSGPILLPGPGGPATRLFGGGKQGVFTLLNTSPLGTIQRFRGAWNQKVPIVIAPDNNNTGNPAQEELDLDRDASDSRFFVNCDKAMCNPSGNGGILCNSPPQLSEPSCQNASHCSTTNDAICCPMGGCTTMGTNPTVMGTYPHIHGQPVYWSKGDGTGLIMYWAEKDFPRYITWNENTGAFSGVSNNHTNTSSVVAPYQAPAESAPQLMGDQAFWSMPGGFLSLSTSGIGNPLLWATIPNDTGGPPQGESLMAVDVSGTLPASASFVATAGGSDTLYPTIANGHVYLASSGPGYATPQLTAYAPIFPITAISRSSGTLDVFFRGGQASGDSTPGVPYTSGWNGSSWTTNTRLSGILNSGIAAVPRGASRIDAYGVGTDGVVYSNSWTGSSWTGWSNPLGSMPVQASAFTPAAVSRTSSTIDLFVRGNDGKVYWNDYNGSSWSGYQVVGTHTIAGPPAAVARGANRIDLYGLTNGGASCATAGCVVLSASWNGPGNSWIDWTSPLGTTPMVSFPVVANPPQDNNHIDVFARGTDGKMYWNGWNGSAWGGYQATGSDVVGSDAAPVSWGTGVLYVLVRKASDSSLEWNQLTSGSWPSGYNSLGGALIGSPVAVSKSASHIDVFVRGTDHQLYTKSLNNGTWTSQYTGLGGTLD